MLPPPGAKMSWGFGKSLLHHVYVQGINTETNTTDRVVVMEDFQVNNGIVAMTLSTKNKTISLYVYTVMFYRRTYIITLDKKQNHHSCNTKILYNSIFN